MAGYLVLNTAAIKAMSSAEFAKVWLDAYARAGAPPPAADWPAVQAGMAVGCFIWAGVSLIASVIIILGGVKMMTLRSYGLAMTGSVLAMIPLISCCCPGGQGLGLLPLSLFLTPPVNALSPLFCSPPNPSQ